MTALLRLTVRQRAVVQGIADGLTCAEVARRMAITEAGVRKHIEAIAKRLPGTGAPLRRILRHASTLLAA